MKLKYILLTLTTLAASLTLMHCGNFRSGGSDNSSSSLGRGETLPPVGFMSAEQMLKAMISSTGTEGLGELTDPADDAINTTYNERSGSLPSYQALDQATGPTLISVANLASTVCAKAVDRDRATGETQRDDRLFFREMDFSKGLGAQSSDAITGAMERLARNSWRRAATPTEQESLVSFAQEFAAGANTTDPAQTRLLAISICTAVLSSVDALTY
ncbi:MAG: hypothetical protein KF799_09340 [Bdellovibrionales bacterium]|nr:hypothetical protein [Bdellovibrionales bacterium]